MNLSKENSGLTPCPLLFLIDKKTTPHSNIKLGTAIRASRTTSSSDRIVPSKWNSILNCRSWWTKTQLAYFALGSGLLYSPRRWMNRKEHVALCSDQSLYRCSKMALDQQQNPDPITIPPMIRSKRSSAHSRMPMLNHLVEVTQRSNYIYLYLNRFLYGAICFVCSLAIASYLYYEQLMVVVCVGAVGLFYSPLYVDT